MFKKITQYLVCGLGMVIIPSQLASAVCIQVSPDVYECSGTTASFTGTAAPEQVTVLTGAEVTGTISMSGGSDTVINRGTVDFINMQGGNDTVTNEKDAVVTNISLSGGNDNGTNRGTVTSDFRGGNGSDVLINEAGATIGGNFRGDGGNDNMTNRGTVSGNILLGGGDDVLLNEGLVSGDIIAGGGNDYITHSGTVTNIVTSAGNDTVINSGTVLGDITMGGDNDLLRNIMDAPNYAVMGLIGGAGIGDRVYFESSNSETLDLSTSSVTGFETIFIQGSSSGAGSFFITDATTDATTLFVNDVDISFANTITADVVNNARFSGAIDITGSYTQAAAGEINFVIDSDTNSTPQALSVSAGASLAGSAFVSDIGDSPADGDTYTLATFGAPYTGTFHDFALSAELRARLFTASLSYNPAEILMELIAIDPPTFVGYNVNNTNLFNAIFGPSIAKGWFAEFKASLLDLDPDSINRAMTITNPEGYLAIVRNSLRNNANISNLISNHIWDDLSCQKPRKNMWFKAIGGYSKDGRTTEHQRYRYRNGGILIGYDMDSNVDKYGLDKMGVSLGIMGTNIESGIKSFDYDGYSITPSLYFSHTNNLGVMMDAIFSYSYASGDVKRDFRSLELGVVTSDVESHLLSAKSNIRKNYLFKNNILITPKGSVSYRHLSRDSVTENVGFTFKDYNTTVLTAGVGVDAALVEHSYGMTPTFSIGYYNNIKDYQDNLLGRVPSGDPFMTLSHEDRQYAVLGLNLSTPKRMGQKFQTNFNMNLQHFRELNNHNYSNLASLNFNVCF